MQLSGLLLTLVILFSSSKLLKGFSQSGYTIKDLQNTDSGGFTSEANAWKISDASPSAPNAVACPACIYTLPAGSCNGASDGMVYGGPQYPIPPADVGVRYFKRMYTGTGGATTNIAIEFDLWVFAASPVDESVDMSAKLWVILADNLAGALLPGFMTKNCGVSISPVTYAGVTANYYQKYHAQFMTTNTGDLTLGIWYAIPLTTNPEFKFAAIRNIYIFPMASTANSGYVNFPCAANFNFDGSTCTTCFIGCQTCSGAGNGHCTGCKSTYYDYQNGYCQTTCDGIYAPVSGTMTCAKRCSTGYYWDRDQSCRATCNAPLVSGTDSNGFAVCNSPCPVTSDFVYPDGSCDANCVSPLTTNIETTLKFCLNPCLNGAPGVSSQFLFPDGSCSGTCPASLSQQTIVNILYCYSGCNVNYFIYPDGSCDANCNGPLTNNVQYTLKFCFSPCDPNNPSLYLYPDGVCKNTCPSPLSTKLEKNIQYCYSICGSQWIYPDQSCDANCAAPLTTRTENAIGFCVSPCDTSNLYLYPEGTCKNTCPIPLSNKIEKNIQYCYSACGSQFLYPDSSCDANCDAPLTDKIEYTIPFCVSPCDSNDQYLYPEGTCKNTCPGPLSNKIERNIQYCYSTCGSQFIYPDASCDANCNAPLTTKTEYTIQFCVSPCDPNDPSLLLYPEGTCKNTCPSPLSNKIERDIQYCFSQCGSQFIYPDASCSGNCDAPLTTKTEYTIPFCVSPCDPNDPSLFLYPEGTCKNTCTGPLIDKTEHNVLYCYSTCGSQYIYPEGTCSLTCDSPLLEKIDYTIPFCSSPCDYSAGSTVYLYPNSSCYSTCTSPLYNKTEYTILECYSPCLENSTFLHENRSCGDTCPSPSLTKDEPIGLFCKYPCSNIDYYYNTGTGKCTKTCEYPGEAVDSQLPKLCVSSLNEEEVKEVKAMAAMANSANSASSTGMMVWSVVSSSDSTAACMGPLAKMLQYAKWMNIMFPEKVLLMMDEQNKDALKGGFAKKMMGGVLEKFPRHELPSKFELYETPSSFFVNFWAAMFNLSVILFVTLTVIILKMMTKGYPKVNGILRGVTDVLKWNLILVTFSGNLGDVVLFTALEFLSMQFDNFEAVFSFALCLLINVAAIFVIVKILDVNAAIRKSMQKLSVNSFRAEVQKKKIVSQWSSYKALFECYKDYSFYQQIFLFVFIIRMAVFNAIIGYLYNYPLFQAIVFSLSNILMLLYLFIKRPMKKIVNLVQQIVLELVLLPFNTCVLTLAILDHQGMEKMDLRKSIGTIIVYINIALPILSLVLMAVKFIAIAIDLYREWKRSKGQKVKRLEGSVKIARPQADIIEEHQLNSLPPSCDTSPSKILSDSTQMIDLNDQSVFTLDNNFSTRNQKGRIRDSRKPHPHPHQNLLTPHYNNNLQTGETLDTQNLDLSYDHTNYQPSPLQLAIMQSGGGQSRNQQRDRTAIGQMNERRIRRRIGKNQNNNGLNQRSRSKK